MRNQLTKGILCLVLSAFFFALMNVFVRLAGDYPVFEKSLFRNLVAFIIAGIVLKTSHEDFHYPARYRKDLIFRSVLGTLGILGNYYAVDHLLLADASAIQKLVPFITVLFSWFLLKEKIRLSQFLCIVGAFVSSLLIIKPGFDLASNIASFAAIAGAIGAGAAYVFVRKLTTEGLNRSKVIFFFSGFSMLAMLPFVLLDFKPLDLMGFIWLLMAGIMAALGQYTVTYAYSFAPAKEISVFDYSQILFSALLGYIFFSQVPDAMSFLGYGLIVAFALLNYGLSRSRRS